MKKLIEAAGYNLEQTGKPLTFDLYRHGICVVQNVLETDFEHYLDMINDHSDITLEVMFFNPVNIPMRTTDFYKWMKKNGKTNFYRINDVREYLNDCFGFVIGKTFVQGDVIRTLKTIGTYYFDNEIAPSYKKVNGFVFNCVGELIVKPTHYGFDLLNDTLNELYRMNENISASRVEQLIRELNND